MPNSFNWIEIRRVRGPVDNCSQSRGEVEYHASDRVLIQELLAVDLEVEEGVAVEVFVGEEES